MDIQPYTFDDLLAQRLNESMRYGWDHRCKLMPGDVIGYDVPKAETKVDGRKMEVKAIISVQSPDNSNDIVQTTGIDLDRHAKLPYVLRQHDRSRPPIALTKDENGKYTTGLDDAGRLVSVAKFFQDRWESEEVFRLIDIGAMGGASIGINVRGSNVEMVKDKSNRQYAFVKASELVEWSPCVIPDNKDTLIIAVQKGLGGKPLSDSLREMLMPYMPDPKSAPVVAGVGIDANGLIVKNDDGFDTKEIKEEGYYLVDGVKMRARYGPFRTVEEARRKSQSIVEYLDIMYLDSTGKNANGDRYKSMTVSLVVKAGNTIEPPPKPKGAKTGEQTEEDQGETVKAGAQVLAGYHALVMQAVDFLTEGAKLQENGKVESWLDDKLEYLAKEVAECVKFFKATYPDLPELQDLTDEDETEPAPEMKKKREKMMEGLDLYFQREKRMSKGHHSICKEAAEFLTDCGKHSGMWTKTHKAAASHHAKELGTLSDTAGGAMVPIETKTKESPAPVALVPVNPYDPAAIAMLLKTTLAEQLAPTKQALFEMTGRQL